MISPAALLNDVDLQKKDGSLTGIGVLNPDGSLLIPGHGSCHSITKFEALCESQNHRPAQHIHALSSQSLTELLTQGHSERSSSNRVPVAMLIEDENDEYCHACGLGGDLVCCESCPATFHAACMGMERLPEGDWHCPSCRCLSCGEGVPGDASLHPAGIQWISTSNYMSPSQLLEGEPNAAVSTSSEDGAVAMMMMDHTTSLDKSLNLCELPKATTVQSATLLNGQSAAVVRCPATSLKCHTSCVSDVDQTYFSSLEASTQSHYLASLAAQGCLHAGMLQDGTNLSIQFIRGAAVVNPTTCSGYSPDYTSAQKEELAHILTAAQTILDLCYAPIFDSRTGHDFISWLVRGAVYASGALDLSGMYTAVLFAGHSIVGVACFRAFGRELAEIPLLAIRPEVRRNKLGSLFEKCIVSVLKACQVHSVVTPAFSQCLIPMITHTLPPLMEGTTVSMMQTCWGYELLSAKEACRLSQYQTVTFPGVVLAVKRELQDTPQEKVRLPSKLYWSDIVDAKDFLLRGLLVKDSSRKAQQNCHVTTEVTARIDQPLTSNLTQGVLTRREPMYYSRTEMMGLIETPMAASARLNPASPSLTEKLISDLASGITYE